MMKFPKGGEVSILGLSIRNLIWLAWNLPPERVTGGPKWLDSDLYDIQAKPPAGGGSTMNDQYLRIQTLLADRLQLRVHRETKMSPVYVLTIAKTGLKIQEAKGPDPSSNGNGSILPWEFVVSTLSQRLGRSVIDKTGLKGVWFVKLQYTSDDGQAAGIGTGPLDRTQPAAGPSIFTAVQEQLGLKLDSDKGLVDTLVIDSVARPSAN